ncbi:MAG: hypothetical protein AAGH90_06925 [Pseudomonadota bacterium]
MNKPAITTERVMAIILAYGAEPKSWPAEERRAAEALVAANPSAFEEAFADAGLIDQALMDESMPEPSQSLATSILDAAPVAQLRPSEKTSLFRLIPSGFRIPASAALASLGVGLMAGYSYAGDNGFDAYLENDASGTYSLGESFDEWLAGTEDEE